MQPDIERDQADPEMLEAVARAEREAKELRAAFVAWISTDLDTLDQALQQLMAADGVDAARVDSGFDIFQNIKGQAATFGFRQITEIADVGCLILRDRAFLTSLQLRAAMLCAQAIRASLIEAEESPENSQSADVVDRLMLLASRVLNT